MLSAIVVAYKTPAELAAAAASLHAQSEPPDEVVIVDHGAADGEPFGSGRTNGARTIVPPVNSGYGTGCNLGADASEADEFLFLNADVVLSSEAIAHMRRRLHQDRQIAAVGPRIMSGSELQLSARAFPRLRTGLLGRSSFLTRLLRRVRHSPTEFRQMHDDGGQVDWVSGACMLVRADAFSADRGLRRALLHVLGGRRPLPPAGGGGLGLCTTSRGRWCTTQRARAGPASGPSERFMSRPPGSRRATWPARDCSGFSSSGSFGCARGRRSACSGGRIA